MQISLRILLLLQARPAGDQLDVRNGQQKGWNVKLYFFKQLLPTTKYTNYYKLNYKARRIILRVTFLLLSLENFLNSSQFLYYRHSIKCKLFPPSLVVRYTIH